jgi:rhodanese-related sulfurtransferase
MKTILRLTVMLSLVYSLPMFSQSNRNIESLSAQEFKKTIETGKVILIDVRTTQEYAQGHIDKAINISVSDPEFAAKVKKLNGKSLALYCRSGRRSKSAISMLNDLKVKIYELNGGIIDWQQAGFPLKN